MLPKVLVLGGTGFIGRHAVASLKHTAAQIVIGTRTPTTQIDSHQQRYIRFEDMTSSVDWEDVAREFNVILNCVGILRPRGFASYERVHHLAPKAIAVACGVLNTRFIHVSALGLSAGDRSGFLTSKRRGESAIQSSQCNWIITRPSLLDGDGGYGATWLRGVSALPLFVLPTDAKGKIAALTVTDLGDALAKLCISSDRELNLEQSRIFELGGACSYDFGAYIRGLRRRYTARPAIAIPIPGWLARLGAHVCDLLHFTPFSFGHWELLRKNNAPSINRLPELLGRSPTQVIVDKGTL